MARIPYMQIYWSDYFGDTKHLTCEQHGAYLQLLGCLWQVGGSMVYCPRKMARMISTTSSRWSKMEATILAFFDVENGLISHKRLMFDYKNAHEKSIKLARSGAQGGVAKSLKYKEPPLADAIAGLKHRAPVPEPYSIKKDILTDIQKKADLPSAEPTASPSNPDPPKSTRSTGVSLPVDWRPAQTAYNFAVSRGRNAAWVDEAAEAMREWAWANKNRAVGRKADWDLTFQGWLRRESDRASRSGRSPPARNPFFQVAEEINSRISGGNHEIFDASTAKKQFGIGGEIIDNDPQIQALARPHRLR